MNRRLGLYAWVAILLTLVIGAVLPAAAQTESAVTSSGTLDCQPGDAVMRMHMHVAEDPAGGPAQADDALTDFLAREFPRLPRERFRMDSESTSYAKFVAEFSERRLAAGHAQRMGDSWYVLSFEACDKFLERKEG